MATYETIEASIEQANRIKDFVSEYYDSETNLQTPRTVTFLSGPIEWSVYHHTSQSMVHEYLGRLTKTRHSLGKTTVRLMEHNLELDTITSTENLYRERGVAINTYPVYPGGIVRYEGQPSEKLYDTAFNKFLGRFLALKVDEISPIIPVHRDLNISNFNNVPVRKEEVDNKDYHEIELLLDQVIGMNLDSSPQSHATVFSTTSDELIKIQKGLKGAPQHLQIQLFYKNHAGNEVVTTLNGLIGRYYDEQRAIWSGHSSHEIKSVNSVINSYIKANIPVDQETMTRLLDYIITLRSSSDSAQSVPKDTAKLIDRKMANVMAGNKMNVSLLDIISKP